MASNSSHRPSTPVRVAVVGLGYWGPNLVRNLVELEDADVPIACDFDESARAKIQRRYPSVRLTDSYLNVLGDPAVDAVAIATPVSTHYELALAALEAGKHVFVEKPLAASVAEAEDLIRRAERAGLILMPGHTFVYSPPVNQVLDLINAGELGEIYFISMSRVNLGLHQPDVSVIWDLGAHDFSILRYWLNELPTHVSAVTRSCVLPGVADVAFVNMQFGSGVVAHVELAWLAPSKLRRTAVVGSQKMVIYDDTSNESLRIFDAGVAIPTPESFGEYRLTYRTGDIISPHIQPTEPLSLELADFCRSIREGSIPVSSAALGLDVIRMIEAAEEAAQPIDSAAPLAEARSASSFPTRR